ncbi:MAG: ABC transporter ATP-binding protein [Lachnospiraceae bacterium]|nr:ABC transporter ATP-binding protein [Lachnospiraceae bacterium]
MALIEIRDVTYKYPFTKKPALHDVNCSIEKGKFYGVIGENGGGKTSLCNLMRGLIPHFYNGELTGIVNIDGTEVRDWNTGELAAKIGYVFQNPFTQISGIKPTVFEEIGMGLENLGMEKEAMIHRILEVSKELDIEDLLQKDPNAMSGGQRQRVAFASILAMDQDIMVIDEPTSQLDPQTTEKVFDIIGQLKNSGKTIILVEHKIDLIARYCDEVILMQGGTIVRQGATADILTDTSIEELGAVVPQTALFGHAMVRAGKSLERIPITVEDAVEQIRKWKEVQA